MDSFALFRKQNQLNPKTMDILLISVLGIRSPDLAAFNTINIQLFTRAVSMYDHKTIVNQLILITLQKVQQAERRSLCGIRYKCKLSSHFATHFEHLKDLPMKKRVFIICIFIFFLPQPMIQ